jgi:tyrosine-protein phosphatase YwqE
MIDWHSHLLPGVDDGPEDIEQSVAIAAALAAGGFTEVYSTPHLVRGCHEAGNDEVLRGVAKLQERLDSGASRSACEAAANIAWTNTSRPRWKTRSPWGIAA